MACAQCGVEGQSMQRCGGCRNVHYCCRDCQRQHWRAGHKDECARQDRVQSTTSTTAPSSSAAAAAPMRTTFRVNMADFHRLAGQESNTATPQPDPADTIYYLMTSIEAFNDRTCMGPFQSRLAFIDSLYNKIDQAAGPAAVANLEEWLAKVGGPDGFALFTVTMPNQGGHKLEVWLHKERNAQVQQALPCPTWKLLYIKIANQEMSQVSEAAMQLRDMQVQGTYLTEAEAESAGTAVANRLLPNGPGGVHAMNLGEGKVWIRGTNPTQMVQVSYDDGVYRM